MRLRTRLLIGYGYLVVLILLTAGGAAVGFFELSKGIGRVVENNSKAASAATDMLGALERQDSAILRMLVDPNAPAAPADDLAAADAAFDAAYQAAARHTVADADRAVLDKLKTNYDSFLRARTQLLDDRPKQALRAYNRQVYRRFKLVRSQVFALLDRNQAAIIAADRQARQTAIQNGVWLGILVTLALLSLIFVSRALQRHFLARLTHFSDVSEAIAEGHTQRRLKDDSDDELGALAGHFNSAIDNQKQLRAEAQGRLSQQRQLLVGALAERDEGVGLVGLDGTIVASTLVGEASHALQAHRNWAADDGRQMLDQFEPGQPAPTADVELGGDMVMRFELLVAQHKRPVGWLVRVEATPPSSG